MIFSVPFLDKEHDFQCLDYSRSIVRTV
uniref:Uncharacterized protein n=1 Tax=Arundo donax TaxID=35708 RepID=A0A0A8Z4P7_ARUDO